jgi:hypothetical protein
MKKFHLVLLILLAVFVGLSATTSWTAGPSSGQVDVYACDCEEGCPCPSPYQEPGKCECGLDLAKMRVLKIDAGTAYLCKCDDEKCPCRFDPADPGKCGCGSPVKEIKTKGRYVCACGPDCGCNSISVTPGKCACGKPMKKVD